MGFTQREKVGFIEKTALRHRRSGGREVTVTSKLHRLKRRGRNKGFWGLWVCGRLAGNVFVGRERRANRPGRLGLARCRCPRVCGEDRGRGEAAMASILIGTMAVTLGIGAAETVRRVMSTPQVTRGRANTHTRETGQTD